MVFVHEKDEFFNSVCDEFPGVSMLANVWGQRQVFPLTKKVYDLSAQLGEACDEAATIRSYRKCMMDGYEAQVGCAVPWITRNRTR